MSTKTLFIFLSLLSSSSLLFANGFYTGFQGGADFLLVNKKYFSEVLFKEKRESPYEALGTNNKNSNIGGVGGILLGYSWQFNRISLGLEGFINGDKTQSKQSTKNAENESRLSFSASEKLRGVYGILLRPGYLVNEKARLYAKGGWAQGHFSLTAKESGEIIKVNERGTGTLKKWVNGWQLGFGSELFINPKLAITIDYNHIKYSKKSIFDTTNGGKATQNTRAQYKLQSNNILLGLTYYFTEQGINSYSLATEN